MSDNRFHFVNPYNFVPLSGERASRAVNENDKIYTGVIKYSVLTKSPLFIPNTSNSDIYQMAGDCPDHKSYDFFTYTDLSESIVPTENVLPVIPGSEIRGMFRSNYEILTNSCMSSVDDDVTLSKRTSENYQAGLMKRTKNEDGKCIFDLYQAKDCLMRTKGANCLKDDWKDDRYHYQKQCYIQKDIPEGAKVYFHYEKRMSKDGRREIKPLAKDVSLEENLKRESTGYVLKGEAGPDMNGAKQQKHCCHIFALNGNKAYKNGISLTTLDKVLTEYKNNGVHLYDEYVKRFSAFREGKSNEEFFPVYYSILKYTKKDNSVVEYLMLSPACITREIYSRKIKDMIGDYRPCGTLNNLCPACSLFGTIGKENGKNFAKTSRIRFSDLACKAETASDCFMDKITLEPLSSPKLNNMEFYLQRPSSNALFWTYDYYYDDTGLHINDKGINGRKFYWHNLKPVLKNAAPSTQNMTVRPVKSGVFFEGKLYFQDLTKTELNQLIYLLDAGEYGVEISVKKHGYKLGAAKPLGFGSIAVSVDQVTVREFIVDTELKKVERKESEYADYQTPDFDKTIERNFEKMTRFDAVNAEISYPLLSNPADTSEEQFIYDWFVNNHKFIKKNDKTGEVQEQGMVNARADMAYAEFLMPMDTRLKAINYKEIKRKQPSTPSSGYSGNRQQGNSNRGQYNKKSKW